VKTRLARGVFALVACAVIGVPSSASPPRADAAPGRLHIHELRGTVGKYTYGGDRYLQGVALRATVCFRSAAEALRAYPTAIGVTHFAVSKSRRRWWPARTVVDRAPWLVPFGENWHGRACGRVWVNDPIPPTHYGVESLGNPDNCYGVELTIAVGASRASKRAIIKCPFGGRWR
jgi:hypothetical protein